MAEWVARLLSGEVQPSLPLPTWFINPQPYYRNEQEASDWIEQVTAQESQVHANVQEAETAKNWDGDSRDEYYRRVLNVGFPQHRRSCDWPGRCQFLDICFGPSAISDDPVASGLFRLRTPVDHTGEGEVSE